MSDPAWKDRSDHLTLTDVLKAIYDHPLGELVYDNVPEFKAWAHGLSLLQDREPEVKA